MPPRAPEPAVEPYFAPPAMDPAAAASLAEGLIDEADAVLLSTPPDRRIA